MTRVLQPELLDELPATDPRAMHSRRDLRRINSIMGNARLIAEFLRRGKFATPLRIAEIGAGDGNVSLRVARGLSATGEIILVDREPSCREEAPGWKFQVVRSDVFAWLAGASRVDVIIANLFLHHFRDEELTRMLSQCARVCDCFIAAEPRRNGFAAWFSRRLGFIGCNEVTLHDAEISVRAGFNDAELSRLWPRDTPWTITEKRAGMFTHFFSARRSP